VTEAEKNNTPQGSEDFSSPRPLDEARTYPVRITPHIQKLIDEHGTDSAIGRQYLPDDRELITTEDESDDPTADHPYTPVAGIVHRHPDRVLLKPLHACAVYCRFCFRREMVGPGKDVLDEEAMDKALSYIEQHPLIWEVILTGGDPLMLSARRLRNIMARLNAIPHVQVVRFHTRVPIADPQRVTDDVIKAITDTDKALYMVVHTNHADELNEDVASCLKNLRLADITLLSQSVLLAGVNDTVTDLENLCRKLVTLKVKPYYLHHPDRAPGTSHFRLSFARGQELMNELRARMTGIALPTYVLDIPGGFGKVPVGPSYIRLTENSCLQISDTKGKWHDYPTEDGA
jgi:lysine 2,3-aminomutase